MKQPVAKKLGYGVLDLGQNAFLNLIGFHFLFFLTDILGISPVLAGNALLIGRIWDAVTDPIVGHWSDRTVTRFGRRRPFIGAGSISIAFFIFAMFTVPQQAGETATFLYVTLFYVLASTSFTLMNIPYQAMLPEITPDFNERTSFIAYRMAFAIIGTLIGAGAVRPLVALIGENGWSAAAAIIGIAAAATGLITVIAIREPKHRSQEEPLNLLRSLAHVLSRKTFLYALLPWAIFQLGVAMVQASLRGYFKYVVGNEGLFDFGVLALLVAALAAIPFYVLLSKKIDKRGSYISGMAWMIVMLIAFVFLMPLLPAWAGVILMAIAGLGLGAHYVMPHSLLPDVIEWDAIQTGSRREGAFASIWAFSGKLGQGLAGWMVGQILGLSGYVANAAQSESAIRGLQMVTGIIPSVIILIGIVVLSRYPITREYYDRMIAGENADEDS
jgi:GPH family glycoside/pentoside/hexuronide:cation symporter